MIRKLKNYIHILSRLRLSNADQFVSKLKRNLAKPIKPALFNLNKRKFRVEDAILVFSENRGGSTWVMEQLQNQLNAISLFEPISSKEFKKCGRQFSSPFYFGEDFTKPVLKSFLKETFEGKGLSSRTLQFNTPSRLLYGNRLLVKMVNVNLIAPWVSNEFNFKYKPVYLIRHPLAILASQMKYGNRKEYEFSDKPLSNFNQKRIKGNSHPYLKFMGEINRASSRYTRFLTEWCIKNRDFLDGRYDDEMIVIYYEDLVLDSVTVFKNITESWGLSNQGLNGSNLNKTSGTTNVGDPVLQGRKQLQKWLKHFSDSEKDELQRLLNRFSIKTYSCFDSVVLRKNC